MRDKQKIFNSISIEYKPVFTQDVVREYQDKFRDITQRMGREINLKGRKI